MTTQVILRVSDAESASGDLDADGAPYGVDADGAPYGVDADGAPYEVDADGAPYASDADGAPQARRSVTRALRALGDQRASRVPASADIDAMAFGLVVKGGGEEYAPRPIRRTGAQSGSHLEEVPRVGPWAADGACRNQTDLFFPVRGQRPQAAIALCSVCPVMEECRAHGLSNPAQLGVLGGLTVEERRRVRADMRLAVKAVRGSEEHQLFAVLEDLARYPVGTWGEIGRSGDDHGTTQLAFELGAGWRPLPPGRWEFDAETDEQGGILRARLVERALPAHVVDSGSRQLSSAH